MIWFTTASTAAAGSPPLTARAYDYILASNGLFKTTYFDLASGSARSEAIVFTNQPNVPKGGNGGQTDSDAG
jgi:hypothetical protein